MNIVSMLRYYWRVFAYPFYWFNTLKQRIEYNVGLENDCDCYDTIEETYKIYGGYNEYLLDTSKPPTRRYKTRKEYIKSSAFNMIIKAKAIIAIILYHVFMISLTLVTLYFVCL